jgi:hypothetical protein
MVSAWQVRRWLRRQGIDAPVHRVDFTDLGRSICFFIDARGEDYLRAQKLLPELNEWLPEGYKAALEP